MSWPVRLLALGLVLGLPGASRAQGSPVADADALRAAISDLNGPGPAAEIELLPGVTYTLPGTAGCADEDDNASGDLDVRRTDALKIFTPDGQPPAILVMTCNPSATPQRVIHVLQPPSPSVTGRLTLRNIVVRNGHAPVDGHGGGVASFGDVRLEQVVFENNAAGDGRSGDANQSQAGAGGPGGAVAISGVLTIEGSTFTGNRAGRGGDGGDSAPGGRGGDGGAVIALGGLTIDSSTFRDNRAGDGGRGGDGSISMFSSGGTGGDAGLGSAAQCGHQSGEGDCGASMTVRGSTFSGNATGNGGAGGHGITPVLPGAAGGNGGHGGSAASRGLGGAILFIGLQTSQGSPALRVENCTLDGNLTGIGGSGGNGASGSFNTTGGPGGSGGHGGHGGSGGLGGAIAAGYVGGLPGQTIATLIHVTATENGAGSAGGAAGAGGSGGGMGVPNGQPGVAGELGGGSLALRGPWESVATIVGTTDAALDGPDCWSPASRATVSVSTDADTSMTACGFGSGSVHPFADFALGALADNGGVTLTRLPGAASVLIDKATGVAGQLPLDQRGLSRPQGRGADIGAVEVRAPISLSVTKTPSATSVTAGTLLTFTITVTNTGTSSPQPGVTIDDAACSNMSAATGDVNANGVLDAGEAFTYTCDATPTVIGTFTNVATASVTDLSGVIISGTASADVEVTGTPTTPTTTTVTVTPTSVASGQPALFAATVAPDTAPGTVTFLVDGQAIGTGALSNGQAAFSTSTLPGGTHQVIARYAGSTPFASSESAPATVTVTVTGDTSLTQYFAEGATGYFRSDIGLLNASRTDPARVRVTLFPESGAPVEQQFVLEPLARRTLDLQALLGDALGVSTRIESDQPVAATRQMTWGDPTYGSTLESGLPDTATRWYFAEGATSIFSLFYLVANPNSTPAMVTLTHLLEGGASPVTQTELVPAFTRRTFLINAVPGLVAATLSTVVTSDVPIVTERAMYLLSGARFWEGGTVGRGAMALSTDWSFAEGATGFFHTYLLLGNPHTEATTVTVRYGLPDGMTITRSYPVAAQSRRTVDVGGEDPLLASTPVAMSASSTLPIVAERAMWWGTPWIEGNVALGSPETGAVWAIGEGGEGGPSVESTYVLVSNASTEAGTVRFTVVYNDGTRQEKDYALLGHARLTVRVADDFPAADAFSVLVESLTAGVPITVESARYQSPGAFLDAGGAALATRIR